MSGGGSSPAPAPSTTTQIQDVPAWEQGYLTNLLGQAQTIAAQPYQQFPGQQVAGFTPDQQQSFNNVEGLNNTYQPTQNAGANSAVNGANTAGNIYNAGAPYAQAAPAVASPQGISSFMSPYISNVVNGITNQANMNWNQHIMPGVNDIFTGNGQFGSGRNAQVLGQAANDFQTNLSSNVANALESGYGMAGNQAATEAGILNNTGSTLGNLEATQGAQQTSAGTALSNIGNQQLQSGLTSAQALQAVGQQQQQQNQANINTAQQNWQNQTQWPTQQTEYLSGIIRGLPAMGSATTSASQQSPVGIYSPSPLSGIGGAGAGALSLLGSNGNLLGTATHKKGGLIKGYAAGGSVDDPTDGADYQDEYDDPQGISALLPSGANDNDAAPSNDNEPDFLSSILAGKQPQSAVSASQPLSYNTTESTHDSGAASNPLASLKAPQLDEAQIQRAQLLSIARGMLSPTRTGSPWESLGNAIGGAEDTGMNAAKWNAEQQARMITPQLEAQRLGIDSKRLDVQQKHWDDMDRHNQAIEALRTAGGNRAGNSAATQKYNMWLTAHPGDTEGALRYASGTKIQDDDALNKTAITLASKDQLGINSDGSMKPQDVVDAYKSALKTGSFPKPVVAAKPPGFFDKLFGSSNAAPAAGTPAPQAGTAQAQPGTMNTMPDAAQHNGRIIKETSADGKGIRRFKSDGKSWNPLPDSGG